MSAETIDIAKLIMINATTVALLVVAPLSYWKGKRSARIDRSDGQPPMDNTCAVDLCAQGETADVSGNHV